MGSCLFRTVLKSFEFTFQNQGKHISKNLDFKIFLDKHVQPVNSQSNVNPAN